MGRSSDCDVQLQVGSQGGRGEVGRGRALDRVRGLGFSRVLFVCSHRLWRRDMLCLSGTQRGRCLQYETLAASMG